MTATSLFLLILTPLCGGVLLLLANRRPNLRESITLITATLLIVQVALMLQGWWAQELLPEWRYDWLPGLSFYFRFDALGLIFAGLASLLWLVNSIYSIGYMRGNEEANQTRFYFFFTVAIAATMGVAMAGNLLTLFFFYELLTLSTYPLVTHKGDERTIKSARVYLGVLLTSSIALFLPAIIWTSALAGTNDFRVGGIFPETVSASVLSILLLLYLFGIGKAAVMPVHRWLPAAMVAPTPVSALLHAVAVVKAGVFTIIKVVVLIFGIDVLATLPISDLAIGLASFTTVAASVVALRQQNLKRLLAYSTIGQLAYVVLAALLTTRTAEAGAELHLVVHGFGKITLFFAAGAIYVASGKTELHQLNGIGRLMPITMVAFAIGALSMIGVPPTAGFISKWFMISGALEAGSVVALIALLLSTALNAGYFLPVIYRAFWLPAAENDRHGEAPWPAVLALSITALLTLALFWFHSPLLTLAWQFLEGASS